MKKARWPIVIQSKGRPQCLTSRRFHESTEILIAIEPQEADEYRSLSRKLLVLPGDNLGLAGARQAVLEHARQHKWEWFWLLDDDISTFARKEGAKLKICSGEEALRGAESLLTAVPFLAQGALDYRQYAWAEKRAVVLDSFCDVAVCFNVPRCAAVNFDARFVLKVDRDLTMQILASGFSVGRCSRFCFDAQKNGSNRGGLAGTYARGGAERDECRALQTKWGESVVAVVEKKSGRVDAKIAWNRLSSRVAGRKIS